MEFILGSLGKWGFFWVSGKWKTQWDLTSGTFAYHFYHGWRTSRMFWIEDRRKRKKKLFWFTYVSYITANTLSLMEAFANINIHAFMLLLSHYVRMFTPNITTHKRPSYFVMFMTLCHWKCEPCFTANPNVSLRKKSLASSWKQITEWIPKAAQRSIALKYRKVAARNGCVAL